LHREAIAEPRKPRDLDPRPPDHPHGLLRDTGVLYIRVGHILEPARDRIETSATGRRAVGQPGPCRLGEDATILRR
jgi:hypothetical protein